MTGGWLILAALGAPDAAAATPAMATPETVAEFLATADAMMALGEQAADSPEADAIRIAVQQAGLAYRAALAEAQDRGEPLPGCPPPPGQAQLSIADLIADFRAFPQSSRVMPVATAFALVMTLRYPCTVAPH